MEMVAGSFVGDCDDVVTTGLGARHVCRKASALTLGWYQGISSAVSTCGR